MLPCTPPRQHTHTHKFALPLLCSSSGSTATHKFTWTGSAHSVDVCPKTKPWGECTKITEFYKGKRREYLALPSGVRGLEEKNQTDGNREKNENNTPILQLYCHYACFARWQSMAITLKAKLSQVHLKAFHWNRQMTNKESNTVCEYKVAVGVVYRIHSKFYNWIAATLLAWILKWIRQLFIWLKLWLIRLETHLVFSGLLWSCHRRREKAKRSIALATHYTFFCMWI